MVTLKLWVSNQVGVDSDCTSNYIEAANWTAPAGIALDIDSQTISGEVAEEVWRAYRSLAAAVAGVGHGTDFDGHEIEADNPILTACPRQLVWERCISAAESLARLESPAKESWAAFVASVPALASADAGTELQDMMEMLGNHGGMFTGNNPADEAENWIDYGFTVDTARPWCDIGIWDAATANAFVAAKLTPEQVAAAAERMTDSLDDPGEEYTDGDPIYAACNGDLDVAKIIQATT